MRLRKPTLDDGAFLFFCATYIFVGGVVLGTVIGAVTATFILITVGVLT